MPLLRIQNKDCRQVIRLQSKDRTIDFVHKRAGRPRNPDLLVETDDHRSYAHHEEHLFIDLPLVRLGLLRLNFITDACPPGLLPDPEFLNSLLLLVCVFFTNEPLPYSSP